MGQHDQPPPEGDAFRICSRIALAVNLLLTLFVTWHIVRSRVSLGRLLADFGSTPSLSQVVLSSWYPWGLAILAGFSVTKELLIKNPRATLIWNGGHLAVVIVLWQLYVAGVLEPLVALVERLGH